MKRDTTEYAVDAYARGKYVVVAVKADGRRILLTTPVQKSIARDIARHFNEGLPAKSTR